MSAVIFAVLNTSHHRLELLVPVLQPPALMLEEKTVLVKENYP